MLTFQSTSDPYSQDVLREGRFLGHCLTHPGVAPQFRPMCAMADCYLTLDEMKQFIGEFARLTPSSRTQGAPPHNDAIPKTPASKNPRRTRPN